MPNTTKITLPVIIIHKRKYLVFCRVMYMNFLYACKQYIYTLLNIIKLENS